MIQYVHNHLIMLFQDHQASIPPYRENSKAPRVPMCGQKCPDYTCPSFLKSAQSTSFVLSSPLSSPDGGWVCNCCVSSSLPCMVASWGCGCLPLEDCTFLPGILSVSCSKNDSVHQLPTRNTPLSVLNGVKWAHDASKFGKSLRMSSAKILRTMG